jgi:hypothetical protein
MVVYEKNIEPWERGTYIMGMFIVIIWTIFISFLILGFG